MDRRITLLAVLVAVLVAAVVMALRPPPTPTLEPLATVPHVDVVPAVSPSDAAEPETEPTSGSSFQAEFSATDTAEDSVVEHSAEGRADFESLVVVGDDYYLHHFQELAESEEFYSAIEQLGADGSSSAAYLSAELRTMLEQHRDIQAGTMTIDSMGCGQRLCLIAISGSAVSSEPGDYGLGLPADSSAQRWFVVLHHVETSTGIELRMMVLPATTGAAHFRPRRPPDN